MRFVIAAAALLVSRVAYADEVNVDVISRTAVDTHWSTDPIAPALAEGSVVLLDRYYWSNAAYQGARGGQVAQIIADNEAFAPRPELVLLLDVDAELGQERIRRRGETPNLFEDLTALTRAAELFRELAQHAPYAHTVAATGALKPWNPAPEKHP